MNRTGFSRREWLRTAGASVVALAARPSFAATRSSNEVTEAQSNAPQESPDVIADRARRMKWWHEARFGMFIHFGLYSVLGRHEWAMEDEGIPVAEYQLFAKQFNPKPHAARAWAKLAKQAGQKYMCMTTKHHEGFCNFDTKLTNYNAAKQAAGRDLVREYVEAAREEGLRVGFYYSLMDWHHPDGARCATDEAARKRFVEYTHGLVRELMTNYGKVDVLWYDVDWPLNAEQWESKRMNEMVFQLQPDIIVNNRNGLPGDFSTPEQEVVASKNGRAWESCMTMNDSWGYQHADDNWKSSKTVVRNLIECANGGGNYLLNIGPKADGSIPEESVRILSEVGPWVSRNAETIYPAEVCESRGEDYVDFTRKGNTLYAHIYFWPGDYVAFSGLRNKVSSVRLLKTGQAAQFEQSPFRLKITGLPKEAPDQPVTTFAIECDSEPKRDPDYVRRERPREGVGI